MMVCQRLKLVQNKTFTAVTFNAAVAAYLHKSCERSSSSSFILAVNISCTENLESSSMLTIKVSTQEAILMPA